MERCECEARHSRPLSLAERLATGEALPTRSVHALHTLTPGREPIEVGDAGTDGARAAVGYASVLVGVALLSLTLSWAVRLEVLVLTVPSGLADRLRNLSELGAWSALAALAVGWLLVAGTEARRRLGAAADRLAARSVSP